MYLHVISYLARSSKYLQFRHVLLVKHIFPFLVTLTKLYALLSILPFMLLSSRYPIHCPVNILTFFPHFHIHIFLSSIVIFLLCLGKLFMVFRFWNAIRDCAKISQSKAQEWIIPLPKTLNILSCRIFVLVRLFAHISGDRINDLCATVTSALCVWTDKWISLL